MWRYLLSCLCCNDRHSTGSLVLTYWSLMWEKGIMFEGFTESDYIKYHTGRSI